MGKPVVLLGLAMIAAPACGLAQPIPGTRDGTNDVRSQNLGVPGPSTNPVDQMIQRQGLQDLGGGQAARRTSSLGRARPAKRDELTAGATVNDNTGIAMAKIESVGADGIVVAFGTAKVKVPADAFGHNKAGLLLDMTRAQFEQIVAKANAAS